MPQPYVIIAPVGKIADVFTALGYNLATGPGIFTLADPTPRTVTHRVRSAAVSPANKTILDAHIANPASNPLLAGVIVDEYTLPGGTNPYPQMLIDNGLTTLQNEDPSP